MKRKNFSLNVQVWRRSSYVSQYPRDFYIINGQYITSEGGNFTSKRTL